MTSNLETARKEFFQTPKEDRIPDWYLNYAEGVPKFAEYFRRELEKFANFEDQNFLNSVALAVAVYTGQKDLMHDISQTMLDRDFMFSRDQAMGAILESMNETRLLPESPIGEEPTDSDSRNEIGIRIAIEILRDNNFKSSNSNLDAKIRAIIGIVEIIARIM